MDPITVRNDFQSIFGHIDGIVRRFSTHHIQMSLQNRGRCVFVSTGCLFKDDDIIGFVAQMMQKYGDREDVNEAELEQCIDDIEAHTVRAIGDPALRFE